MVNAIDEMWDGDAVWKFQGKAVPTGSKKNVQLQGTTGTKTVILENEKNTSVSSGHSLQWPDVFLPFR